MIVSEFVANSHLFFLETIHFLTGFLYLKIKHWRAKLNSLKDKNIESYVFWRTTSRLP